jgi:hypothetical protein
MSYALVVYSVSRGEIQRLLGSHDVSLLDEIHREDGDFLAEIDEHFEDSWDEDVSPLTMREAIEHFLAAGSYRDDADELYILAFETLCRARGRELDNRAFQPPIRWGWIEQVDRFLARIAFPLRVAELAAGGVPFDFPHRGAIPSIGHWPHEPLQQALDLLVSYRLDGVPTDLAEALASIVGWLNEALKDKDNIIVGVYS